MKSGRVQWQKEDTRKDTSILLIHQEKKFLISELFKVIQGRNLIDYSLQDNVLILDHFFEYIYHIGCDINLHSIMNSGLIPGGQNIEQQTDSIFSACGSHGQKP